MVDGDTVGLREMCELSDENLDWFLGFIKDIPLKEGREKYCINKKVRIKHYLKNIKKENGYCFSVKDEFESYIEYSECRFRIGTYLLMFKIDVSHYVWDFELKKENIN